MHGDGMALSQVSDGVQPQLLRRETSSAVPRHFWQSFSDEGLIQASECRYRRLLNGKPLGQTNNVFPGVGVLSMLQCFTARLVARFVLCCLGVMMLFTAIADAQSALSLTGQLRSAYPQSTLAEPIAAVARSCSSISSLSRRCYFTFDKECKKRGESKEHCTRMSGFCVRSSSMHNVSWTMSLRSAANLSNFAKAGYLRSYP